MISHRTTNCTLGLVAIVLFGMPATAQTPATQPDLNGIWSNASLTKLQRPANAKTLVVTKEEALVLESGDFWNKNEITQQATPDVTRAPPKGEGAEFLRTGYNSFWLDWGKRFAEVKGEIRTSFITVPDNGKLPLKPGVTVGRPAVQDFGTFNSYETRPPAERCVQSFSRSAGPVLQNGLYNNHYQIVQTDDHVMILAEMVHEARIIPIFASEAVALAQHQNAVLAPSFGDSVGWYENGALVVHTTHVPAGLGSLLSPAGVLTERFSRWSKDQIVYEFAVDDAEFYTQPWRGEMGLNASQEQIYEYACHEGNTSFPGILAGARTVEAGGGSLGIVDDAE